MSEKPPNPSCGNDPDPTPTASYRGMLTPPAPSRPSIGLFILGVLTGAVASIAVYAVTIRVAPRVFAGALISLIAGKIIFGIQLIRSPRTASFGKGILCSIGLMLLLTGAGVGYLAYRCFNP
jgi:hypothetical protein